MSNLNFKKRPKRVSHHYATCIELKWLYEQIVPVKLLQVHCFAKTFSLIKWRDAQASSGGLQASPSAVFQSEALLVNQLRYVRPKSAPRNLTQRIPYAFCLNLSDSTGLWPSRAWWGFHLDVLGTFWAKPTHSSAMMALQSRAAAGRGPSTTRRRVFEQCMSARDGWAG
jgi:hypothetical protein